MAMRLPDSRYDAIKQTVVELFIRYDVNCIPINGFEIAAKMGIDVVPYSAYPPSVQEMMRRESPDSFFIEKNDGKQLIYYDSDQIYGRMNQSIMHEIGHIVLGHTQESELAEAEAKFFAKYALAPPALVHRMNPSDPYALAEYFDISFQAACIAWDYYRKWLAFSGTDYASYEYQMLKQFQMIG